jgi:DNA topoisomerase-1
MKQQTELSASITGPEAAKAADLRYVSDQVVGISRRKNGAGFVYYDAQGQRLKDSEAWARIEALVIPPAWSNVWICPDAAGHIQATGRDERGRKQYIYHQRWEELRNAVKFDRMLTFAEALPQLRRQITSDLQTRTLSRPKVAAIALSLLDKTRMRIGNPEYRRQNESYGLTTLQDQHVAISGPQITFMFRGKHGREHTLLLEDKRLARLIRQCQELPGQELLQYRDEEGIWRPLRSNEVNEYLRSVTGQDFTAKDFRTWGGTVAAATALYQMGASPSEKEQKGCLKAAIKQAAQELGNTTTVCRKYYVHPRILAAYCDGTLFSAMQNAEAAADLPAELHCEEKAVLYLLRQPEPAQPRKRKRSERKQG